MIFHDFLSFRVRGLIFKLGRCPGAKMASVFDEFLDQTLQDDFKNLDNVYRSLVNVVRRIKTAAAEGNLEALRQALVRHEELVGRQQDVLQAFQEKLPQFNLQAFLQEDFHRAFLDALAAEGLAVEGEYPVYEVQPFKIRVLPEKEMVTINDKVYRNLRPGVLARHLKKEIERLQAAPFDAGRFLAALAAAYDTETARQIVRKKIEVSEQEVLLRDVYHTLTPLPQQKRAYPLQFFAFDLHRLLRSGQQYAPDGRRFFIGNVRDNRKALVVLDAQGHPQCYGVMKFYREG